LRPRATGRARRPARGASGRVKGRGRGEKDARSGGGAPGNGAGGSRHRRVREGHTDISNHEKGTLPMTTVIVRSAAAAAILALVPAFASAQVRATATSDQSSTAASDAVVGKRDFRLLATSKTSTMQKE